MQDETSLRPEGASPVTIEEKEDRDLGFGPLVTRESRQRFLNKDGSFNVVRGGMPQLSTINLYHWLLFMSWARFLGLILLLYFLSNVAFGLMYAAIGPEAIVDTSSTPSSNTFIRGFFFSVQTFATIGYGTIHPVGLIPNLLVTIESYYSLLANALITGVVFARFSRPTANVRFSKVAVIAPYRGITGFMFRLVNTRSNQLLEVEAKLLFVHMVNENGRVVRRFDPMELERRKVTFFPLAWTVVHPIDENSPLRGLTEEDLYSRDAEFLILLTAIDETSSQTVHARSSFKPQEVIWSAKFANIYKQVDSGDAISIDIRKLSQIEKVADN
jgi:inward rectifier potassium channel